MADYRDVKPVAVGVTVIEQTLNRRGLLAPMRIDVWTDVHLLAHCLPHQPTPSACNVAPLGDTIVSMAKSGLGVTKVDEMNGALHKRPRDQGIVPPHRPPL